MAGVRPIVEAEPQFIYPQQAEHDEDETVVPVLRCPMKIMTTPTGNTPRNISSTRTAPGTLTTTTPVVM